MANRRKIILETPNRRRKKRRRSIQKILIIFIFVCLLIAGVIGFFNIPYLRTTEVTVVGTKTIDPAALQKIAVDLSSGKHYFIIPKDSTFFYPKQQIQQRIREQFKDINSLEIKRKSLQKIEIDVKERSPYAWYCLDTCFVADETGYIYEAATSTDKSFVTFHDVRPEYASSTAIGSYPLTTDAFKSIEDFASNLAPLNLHLNEVIIGVNNDVTVDTQEGKLVISFRESLPDQLDILKTALSQPVFQNSDGSIKPFGYIDLRFGNKIFYKMSGDPNLGSSATSTDSASSTDATTSATSTPH